MSAPKPIARRAFLNLPIPVIGPGTGRMTVDIRNPVGNLLVPGFDRFKDEDSDQSEAAREANQTGESQKAD